MTKLEVVARAIAGHVGIPFELCPKDKNQMAFLSRDADMGSITQDDLLEAARAAIDAADEFDAALEGGE